MRDPFKITGPTCISFSGGRTSAYMLWRVLQAHKGGLPPEAVVCFANTGKEDEATLRFVRDCEWRWGVPVVWLEYQQADDASSRWRVVDFDTASRNGEPFEAVIRQRNYLPNPVTRFCTSELKIRVMHKWLRANWQNLGWDAADMEWGPDDRHSRRRAPPRCQDSSAWAQHGNRQGNHVDAAGRRWRDPGQH